jgi:hypothetical protein
VTFDPSQPRVPAGGPGGGRWGAPRNAKAADAQKDKTANKTADRILSMNTSERGALIKTLPDDQLKSLTAFLYASPTSDPDIVKARIAVANEMSRRGFDVKDYGALGGGRGSHGASRSAGGSTGTTHPRGLSRATTLRQAAARSAAAQAKKKKAS